MRRLFIFLLLLTAAVPAFAQTDALRFYTIGSAWFSHDEKMRGSLEAGKLADLAVSKDYMYSAPPFK